MVKKDPLFLLIKGLTKEEKRHFKLSMSKYQSGNGKDYLRLFDVMDEQKEYDEPAIRKKFKDEAYFKHLRSVKMYLHRQIMKSLRNFHDELSCGVKLNNYITEIEVLCKKGLYTNCMTTIKKAKAYAEKHEKFPKLLEIIGWESHISFQCYEADQIEAINQRGIDEEKQVLVKYDELLEQRRIRLELRSFTVKTIQVKTEKEKQYIEQFISNPWLHREMKSLGGEMSRLITLYSAMLIANKEPVDKILNQVIELIERNPQYLEEKEGFYIEVLQEQAKFLLTANQFNAADRVTLKIRNIYTNKYEHLNLWSKIKFLILEVSIVILKGDFAAASGFIPEVNKLLESNHEDFDIEGELILHYLALMIYFRNNDYNSAFQCIRKIIDCPSDTRTDLQSEARIINVLLQYEQKEYDHLGYVLRSTYRHFIKKKRLHEPEISILAFLKKALRINSEKQLLKAFSALREQIAPYTSDTFIANFSIIEWIDSKLQKRELSEIVKENYQQAIKKENQLAD